MDRQAVREVHTAGSASGGFCWLGDPVAHNSNGSLLTLCLPGVLLAVVGLCWDSWRHGLCTMWL